MQEHESIQVYLKTVADQIRWKRARPILIQELERHLEDQRDALAGEGKSLEEAERFAIEDMGDPIALGAELDCVHRPRPQWGLLGLTLGLTLTGAFLRVSLTAGLGYEAISWEKTLFAMLLGTACLLGTYFLDISRLARRPRAVYAAALVVTLLFLWLSPTRNHASYYTRYPLLTAPIIYAIWLYSCRDKRWKGFLLAILGGMPLAVLCAAAPYMTALLLLLFSGLVLLLYAIWHNWFGISRLAAGGTVLALVLAVLGYIFSQGYGSVRLTIALHPELDPLNRGFHGLQIRRVLGASQWIGEGMLNTGGLSLERFLPEATKDTLPTLLVYKLGWLPYLLLIAATAGLAVWLLVRGLRQKHRLGCLIALAAALTLGLQCLFSVVMNLGVVLFGAAFPLLSGNLHTILNMAIIGLALSVFRGDSIAREEPLTSHKIRHIKRIRLKIEYE